ncbi:MAG: hypothetical protein AAFV98_02840 [Chloroflexota bacterium]
MSQPLHIRGAKVWDGEQSVERDLFIKHGRIVESKPNGALEVDLEGYTLFPGMVNAHDHLELNHYPRTKFREVYDNAHQWGEDVNAQLDSEPFRTLRRYPLKDRLFIGGLKNLLCGATTVAHHGPKYREMYARDFPVRVLKNYGWAHSLHFDTDEEIVRSYKNTPKHHPWFIHLAEGTDEVAAGEYQRLKALGCVGTNTVIVHGVGLDVDLLWTDYQRGQKFGGIVICPSTNDYLLGTTLNVGSLNISPDDLPTAVGTDSRLTAKGDTYHEFRALSVMTGINLSERVWSGFLECARNIVNRADIGHLVTGALADFQTHITCKRHEKMLIIQNGIPRIGDPEMMAKFSHVQTVACTLDGVEKRIHIDLARQIHRCTLKERGLVVDVLPTGKRFFFF